MSSLKHISTVFANGTIPVHKYKSELTGLTVVIGEVEGPLVSGDIMLATEAHDDDGLPHTLEHLIFLGSELYPFKGVLDLLANRCLASGTNAWTDTDHTCYTVKTVGKNGFLNLLPIYLDHVLYPTLSDAGFITEVHHISGDGEDGGVVYCEMQGRENSAESRSYLELLRKIYPNCGYSAETGGIMKNLRTSTTNKKVRDYHSEFYRPENMTVIITGQVKIDEVAEALAPLEKRMLEKPKKAAFTRPWQTPIEPLAQSENLKILYPSSDEDCGLIVVGWRGPKCAQENLRLTACSVLLRYLSDTSVAPLQRELVEVENPYASNVSYNIIENYETLLYIAFENVPLDKIDRVFDRMQGVLKKIADGTERIDMKRLTNILERIVLEYFSTLESNPHDSITFSVIGDALYGETEEDFDIRLNVSKQIKELLTQDETFWIGLLKQYLVEGNFIAVRAVPSIAEQQRMAKEEAARVEVQRKDLGPEGLATKSEELAHAMATNELPPPQELLTLVPIPDVTNITALPSTIYERTNDQHVTELQEKFGIDLRKFPVNVTACDIHTTFGYLTAYLNTNSIPVEKRPYLLLLLELLTESPIRRPETNELIPHEQVVAALESDTVSVQTSLGLESCRQFSCGSFSHTAVLMLKVDYRKYVRGIRWIVDLLQNTEFTVERVRICGAKIANAVAQAKRNGNAVTRDLLKAIFYTADTNIRTCSMIQQHRFLTTLLEKLDTETGVAEVIAALNSLRTKITSPNRLSLYIAGDWEKISSLGDGDLVEPWLAVVKASNGFDPNTYKQPQSDHHLRSSTLGDGVVLGLGCIESAFLNHAVHCPINIDDDSYIPLMLFMQYLTQLEGPFWRVIRGQGFAYSYNMHLNLHEHLLYFTLFKATNLVAAFKQFKSITEAQIAPDAVWDNDLLESAKSSLIFEFIEREKSIDDVVLQNFISNCFYGTNRVADINRINIQKISKVTIADMVAVGKQFVCQFFTQNAKIAVVCHPDKAEEVANEIKLLGFPVTVTTSIQDSVLGQCGC